jgi:hypothetical protein
MIKYSQQARELLEYTNQLIDKGYRKKDIAALLETPAPVFSSLFKTILPILAEISPDDSNPDEKIQFAFSQVNNMSSSKTLQFLEGYVTKLEMAVNKNLIQQDQDYFSLVKSQARNSYDFIKKYYEGLYELFYVASDHDLVKREPFLIRANPIDKVIEVRKGNKLSSLHYKGIAFLSAHHTLTCQIAEVNDTPQEHIMMHLSIPFIRKAEFLRGIILALNYACQPLARKVIIKKVTGNWEDFNYDEIESIHYQPEESEEIKEIHQYLTTDERVECFSIPSPKFNLLDLVQELKVGEQIKNQKL